MIDEIVFRKAKNGDAKSFYELIKPIENKLYKIAYVYTRNEDDALDCVHDAIVKGIKSINSLKEPQYFNTWICRVTANTCKDYIKKNSKVTLVRIEEYELVDNLENNVDYMFDINKALEDLSEKERNLIVMRYIEDRSLKDIARETVTPLGTVKSTISRTLKKLRVCMGGI